MDHFHYKNGVLHAENVSIPELSKAVGTPFYCYSTATLLRHYQVFSESFANIETLVCFAVKANSNIAVLRTLGNAGAGGDCVSEGEIRRCRAAGIPGERIVFSGVGKTAGEMAYALQEDILQFNVESEAELRTLSKVATSMGKTARVALRVNPDVEANTHDKISTGRKQDKFGIAIDRAPELYDMAASLPGIKAQSVSTHIGSQLTALKPFQEAFMKMAVLVQFLRSRGHTITHLDLGGGLGIPYRVENPPSPVQYAEMVINATRDLGCKLIFEPGRLITGNAGILVTQVIYNKENSGKHFLVIDAAMNDLMRPSLYDAYHTMIPVQEYKGDKTLKVEVVGPICETGDVLGKDRDLPPMKSGDLLAIRTTGAYGAVMSNQYNTRLLIPEVMVNDDTFAVIRPRETYEDVLAREVMPGWL